MTDETETPELDAPAYLRELSEKLFRIPATYGTDGYDVDRTRAIAHEIEMQPKPDLTGPQARAAIDVLSAIIGPQAEIHVSMFSMFSGKYSRKECWSLSVYPDGMIGKGAAFSLEGTILRDLIATASEKWEELAEAHVTRTISAMALEIIRLTDEHGEATDAALRSAGYEGSTVARYGKRAAERATEMAGRGPFALKVLGGDNGAPKEDEEEAR